MTEVLQTIAASNLFRGLVPEQCTAFGLLAREQSMAKDEYLFRLGEPAEVLFIVRSGVIHLTMPLSVGGGEHEVVVEEAHQGDMIAWSALIEPHLFTMTAKAATPVELLAFSRHQLQTALALHPDVGLRILANVASVIGRRLQVMQAMWTREFQRSVNVTFG